MSIFELKGMHIKRAARVVTLVLMAAIANAQVSLKSPAQVQKALTTLNRVVDHTQRLIDAKNYTRLPHEDGEFSEGVTALRRATADESSDFRERIEKAASAALAASHQVVAAAHRRDDAGLAQTHQAFADAVKSLLAQFPSSAQPLAPDRNHEKAEDRTQ